MMSQESEIEQLRNELKRAQERIAALEALQDVALNLMSELNLEKLLKKILRSAVEVLKASGGSLLLWDAPKNELVFSVSVGEKGKILEGRRMPAYKGIAGWVFTYRQPTIVHDVTKDERFFSAIDESLGYRTTSLIAAPLMAGEETIGTLEVINKRSGEKFNQDDLDVLCALAAQAAIAIVNARLYQEVRKERDRIASLETEVRRELARDFHDGPAQTLAAMVMDLDFVCQLISRDPKKALSELERVKKAATRTMHQVRHLIFKLRPLALETEGLEAALYAYTQGLRQAEDLNVHLMVGELSRHLPQKVEEVCFAIVQEALNNVKRHAQANNVWVKVYQNKEKLMIIIRDDGQGFNTAQVEEYYRSGSHMGLLNMKERAQMVGGQLSIQSIPGQGTIVKLSIPLSRQQTLGRGTAPLFLPPEHHKSS